MGIYYFVLAFLPMAIVASMIRSRDSGIAVLILTALVAILISGMRWASDVDHLDYADMFAETPDLANFNKDSIWHLHGEPGYLLISAALKTLGFNFAALSAACAVFSIGAKAFVAGRFSRSAGLVLCLYLCIHFITIEFIQIRWAVATALIALAFHFQFHRKRLVTFTLLALAVGIHYFAALFIVVSVLAELRKERLFYFIVVAISLIGFVLAGNGLVISTVVESDLYVIKRTFRYLGEPLSNVGLLSYAKLAIFPAIYFLMAKQYPSIATDALTTFLRRIAFASIAVTLLLSFVPLMHFRAVVIADFFSLLLIVRMLDRQPDRHKRIAILLALSSLYAVWYVLDISNYVTANRLYEYQTWIHTLI